MSERITDADQAFWHMVATGKALMESHLNYEQAEPYPLKRIWTPGVEQSFYVKKMVLGKGRRSLIVNESLTLERIPLFVYDYMLGNRSALEWVIDQYQVTTDERSHLVSDPNKPDDPEYIVRLVCQVITVSLETVRLVNELRSRVHFNDFKLEEMDPTSENPLRDYWTDRGE